MLTREQMPDDNAKLAAIPVELPYAPLDKVTLPEKIVPHLLDYLRREGLSPDGELRFLRTAAVERMLYWIWGFETNGEPAYATASTRDRQSSSAQVNHWGLTPEQFIMAEASHDVAKIEVAVGRWVADLHLPNPVHLGGRLSTPGYSRSPLRGGEAAGRHPPRSVPRMR